MSVTLVALAWQLPLTEDLLTQRLLNITIPQTLGLPLLRQEPEVDHLCLPEPGALQMGLRTLLASLKYLSNG